MTMSTSIPSQPTPIPIHIREREMLAEVLLVLAGHPSSFFIPFPAETPERLRVAPTLSRHLHPGEEQALNQLAQLAFHYTTIRTWARSIQERGRQGVLDEALRKGKGKAVEVPDTYTSTLAGSILDVLQDYELLLVEVESDILHLDEGLAQDELGYVPLSILLAKFSIWQGPLASLKTLVDKLSGSELTPGLLLDHLITLSDNGNARLSDMYRKLYRSLLRLFLTHMVTFLLSGIAPAVSTPTSPSIAIDAGTDPLSPQHRVYTLNTDLFPESIASETRESILYVGRVTSTLKREGRSLPKVMVDDLRRLIMSVEEMDDGLERAIQRTREEVGEWLWKHILTGPQVAEALKSFGDYFLTRKAEYTLSLIREVDRLRMEKLILSNPHSSSSVIREQDLNLAILRASVGTSAENDRWVEKLRFKLERGSLRPFMPSAAPKHATSSDNGIRGLFSSFLLGAPMTMTTTMGWPMDLFITPPAMTAYIDINVYLTAIRDTHLKVLSCWSSLSASQRRRRRWTGSNEGGTRAEIERRQYLARLSWGVVRAMLFFLDQLLGHFMVDIIDVQHRRLLDSLEEVNIAAKQGMGSRPSSMRGSVARAASPGSRFGGTSTSAGRGFAARNWEAESPNDSTHDGFDTQTIRTRAPPSSARPAHAVFLDFLTLRQMHTRHLAFLREGLLIADTSTAVLVRDILDVCRRFTSTVERWGGDVLPELLMEGASGEEIGQMLDEREKAVTEVNENLHELLSDFFRVLVDAQNPSAEKDSSTAGVSFSRTSRATQMLQLQSSRVMARQASFAGVSGKKGLSKDFTDKALDVEASMGRHLEQLLLRLDFNGVLTAWRQKEEDIGQTDQILPQSNS